MSIVYKIDIIKVLKERGWSTYRIEREKAISTTTLQRIRKNEMVSMDSLDRICRLLNMQPGDLIEFVDEQE